MENKIDVLVDRRSNDLSIVCVADGGEDVEITLSIEQAWAAVASLNEAIQKLSPESIAPAPSKKTKPSKLMVTLNITGEIGEELIRKAVVAAMNEIGQQAKVREAVLEAIGADQIRPRHLPPGEPRTIPIAGLREGVTL